MWSFLVNFEYFYHLRPLLSMRKIAKMGYLKKDPKWKKSIKIAQCHFFGGHSVSIAPDQGLADFQARQGIENSKSCKSHCTNDLKLNFSASRKKFKMWRFAQNSIFTTTMIGNVRFGNTTTSRHGICQKNCAESA